MTNRARAKKLFFDPHVTDLPTAQMINITTDDALKAEVTDSSGQSKEFRQIKGVVTSISCLEIKRLTF